MSNFEAMNPTEGSEGEEVWHAQLASGELRVMTLDQLDAAFQEGLVSEDTFVCQAGMSDWVKLGELAGLDAGAGGDAQPEERSATFEQGDEFAKNFVITSNWNSSVAPQSAPAPQVAAQVIGPPGSAYGANARSFPPVVMGPDSTTPYVHDQPDLEFDTDPNFRSRSSKTRRLIAVAAVGGVGLAGILAAVQGGMFKSDAGSVPPVQAAMMVAPAAPAPEPAPAANVAGQSPSADGNSQTRLSDDAKRALLEADKVRAEKTRAKVQQQRASQPTSEPRRRMKTSAPFHKGGNRYDPLNSSL